MKDKKLYLRPDSDTEAIEYLGRFEIGVLGVIEAYIENRKRGMAISDALDTVLCVCVDLLKYGVNYEEGTRANE